MKKYYSPERNAVVFVGSEATAGYWDAHWKAGPDIRQRLMEAKGESTVLRVTRKYLRPGDGTILEGGCGRGHYVYELQKHGYDCVGIDFAPDTIACLNEHVPEIDVRRDDVRKLSFPDDRFIAYWSLGVIEHFYEGYRDIAEEMRRVVKPEGYAFLVFPQFSPLRKLKALLGLYPKLRDPETKPDGFYQFGLDPKQAIALFKTLGFEILDAYGKDGLKGAMDEIGFARPFLEYLYAYKGKALPIRIIRKTFETLLSPVSGHSVLIVMRNRKGR